MYRAPSKEELEIFKRVWNFSIKSSDLNAVSNGTCYRFYTVTISDKNTLKNTKPVMEFKASKFGTFLHVLTLKEAKGHKFKNKTIAEAVKILTVEKIVTWAKDNNMEKVLIQSDDVGVLEALLENNFNDYTKINETDLPVYCGRKKLKYETNQLPTTK